MADREPERVLLVEGQDDKHVVRQLRLRSGAMPSFDIKHKGGIDELLKSIGPEIKVSGRKAVGILVDANDNPGNRWKAIRRRLQKQGFQPPASPHPTGTILSGRPRIGIWLCPDNERPGELEDFVEAMIPQGDSVWPRSQAYIDDIPESVRRFREDKALKAKLYAWLATRETPQRMGTAIQAQELDIDGALAMRFADWLRQLFA